MLRFDYLSDVVPMLLGLTVFLSILRLTGALSCSWWIIMLPLWLPVLLIILLVAALICHHVYVSHRQ